LPDILKGGKTLFSLLAFPLKTKKERICVMNNAKKLSTKIIAALIAVIMVASMLPVLIDK